MYCAANTLYSRTTVRIYTFVRRGRRKQPIDHGRGYTSVPGDDDLSHSERIITVNGRTAEDIAAASPDPEIKWPTVTIAWVGL